ncbi:dihydropteroate synthase [Aquibacillus rhizosphaerae]|uniref:Dihydropteroate synthase n=1 Tax=Aquibacillus rhizosphaerae TaxID=3051431 RepID=A0ABT7L3R8_9BACI|nr:dihydropteroate synthase [Aquibacillus sp. LR5S19]MDL4840507.1 dihydropteroate synthase [Aquibacillus sp. LR5S19]
MQRWLMTKEKKYNLNEKTLIMGILNITPDSFSDGGKFNNQETAVKQAMDMEKAGADIIDIGGESTRPGHQPVTEEEELERVLPIIRSVKKAINIPISIDTYKAETAKRAVEAGASIINDVWGAKKQPEIAEVAATYNVPIVLMHNRTNMNYNSLIEDIKDDLRQSIEIVRRAGVEKGNIILDPGIGFAKTVEDNLNVLKRLDELKDLGYPLLLGTSRKSMIGNVLNLPANQRDEGTGATVCYGITKGTDIVRVHNVEMCFRMTKMMDVLMGKGGNLIG